MSQWKNVSVSEHTMRPQDLVPRFLTALKELDSMRYIAIVFAVHPLPPAYVEDEGDDSEWWDSEECQHFLWEELFDALNDCAPDGFYFGAHPGNGSDYGFWESEEI